MDGYTQHTMELFEATDMLTVTTDSPHGRKVSHYYVQTLNAIEGHSKLVSTQYSLQLL